MVTTYRPGVADGCRTSCATSDQPLRRAPLSVVRPSGLVNEYVNASLA